jgi:hypothetical protein
MKADKDENAFISEKELDEVMLRLKVFGSRRGKGPKFDEELVRAAFKSSMTDQGASLVRIQSAIRKQQQQQQQQVEDEKQQQQQEDEERLQHQVTAYDPVAYSEREIRGTQSQPIVIDELTITGSEEATRQAGICC